MRWSRLPVVSLSSDLRSLLTQASVVSAHEPPRGERRAGPRVDLQCFHVVLFGDW